MTIFSSLSKLLKSPVGNNLANDPDDVKTVKSHLQKIGFMDDPQDHHGYITKDLDTGIRAFQKKNDLRVDGVMYPGGETEQALVNQKKEHHTYPTDTQVADATGRMFLNKAASVPLPAHKPETGINPPGYKKEWFEKRRPPQEWKDWTRHTEFDPNLSSAEKKAFQDIFAAEGGMEKNKTSSAYAGIINSTFEGLKKQGFVVPVVARHGPNVKNTDLNMSDIKEVYKGYFDDALKSAALGVKRQTGRPIKGHKLLGTIGDNEIASATADTLFREAPKKTSVMVQKALNKALPPNEHVSTIGGMGTQTINGLRTVAKDPQRKRVFLDTLGALRDKEFTEPGDPARNEYFRFRKNP